MGLDFLDPESYILSSHPPRPWFQELRIINPIYIIPKNQKISRIFPACRVQGMSPEIGFGIEGNPAI